MYLTSFSQKNADNYTPEIFTVVEEQAEFPGGIAAMIKYIQSNLTYPEIARKLGVGGKVFLKFVIYEDGSIHGTEVLRGSGSEAIDDEALRVVQNMPAWKAARMSGRAVKCYFNLPLSFKLEEPFYIYSQVNMNAQYKTFTNMLFNGKADEAFALIHKFEPALNDVDFMYNKAVLLFNFREKKKACLLFKQVTEISDEKSFVYANSSKFYNKYCN